MTMLLNYAEWLREWQLSQLAEGALIPPGTGVGGGLADFIKFRLPVVASALSFILVVRNDRLNHLT